MVLFSDRRISSSRPFSVPNDDFRTDFVCHDSFLIIIFQRMCHDPPYIMPRAIHFDRDHLIDIKLASGAYPLAFCCSIDCYSASDVSHRYIPCVVIGKRILCAAVRVSWNQNSPEVFSSPQSHDRATSYTDKRACAPSTKMFPAQRAQRARQRSCAQGFPLPFPVVSSVPVPSRA